MLEFRIALFRRQNHSVGKHTKKTDDDAIDIKYEDILVSVEAVKIINHVDRYTFIVRFLLWITYDGTPVRMTNT